MQQITTPTHAAFPADYELLLVETILPGQETVEILLSELCLSEDDCERIMLEAYYSGTAQIMVTNIAYAQLCAKLLGEAGLAVSIRKLD